MRRNECFELPVSTSDVSCPSASPMPSMWKRSVNFAVTIGLLALFGFLCP
jgi:hypothetical protein